LEGDICYCQEAGFAWCTVSWYPAFSKGIGTGAEAVDAMDGDGGNGSKAEYQTVSGFRESLQELREQGLC
jgi:hypothetical protein